MTTQERLVPAAVLVEKNRARFPNESEDYRAARNALLREEIEVRRQIERVAEMRRRLPPGGEVPQDYAFVGEDGPVRFSELFADKDTLVVYSYMFGPQRAKPCPMCTSLMGSFESKVPDFEQRIALAFVARSPIERLVEAKAARDWRQVRVYSDGDGAYTRDYVGDAEADIPAMNVFTRRDGTIRHFWAGEIGNEMSDPGQDPRGEPELDPLWRVLDMTPEGRGGDWYPKLSYG
jgi:predicted dithiol-disulfide oxidoreductase (DUF899 family)